MTFEGCAQAMDGRCRLYEALPSMLLSMNGLPSLRERMAAARDAHGSWALVEAARGDWKARKASTAGELAYDHQRTVGRAGVDFVLSERVRAGVSAHALKGKAAVAGAGGEAKLNGAGMGVSTTWTAGGFYVDAQAQATSWGVDLKSHAHGRLPKKDVRGAGVALGVDVGARMPAGGRAFVTPRAGVGWSQVDLSAFTDMETAGGPRARVSMADAGGVTGRLGVLLEAAAGSSGRLFGSLDVEQAFWDETEVRVGGELLKTEVRPAAARLGAGAAFAVSESVSVGVTAGWRTSGGGTTGYGGGLELQARF